jgi:DNA-binding MarR family transcriptional regulator
MADLKVGIGADTSELQKGLNDAIGKIGQLETAVKGATGDVGKFQTELLSLGKTVQGLGPTIPAVFSGFRGLGDQFKKTGSESDKLGDKLKKLPSASNGAGFALQNIGRIASDAPFGFIAIQNNIDPLIESFSRLKTSTGSTGGALKALGASLAGPAGVLLGFTLVSSAVTVAIQKYGSLGAAINALFGDYTQLDRDVLAAAKSFDKFNESARQSNEIIRTESASVAGEISKVEALAKIVDDQTKSYNERNAALNQLKAISKDYFSGLDIEKGKVEGLKDAVFGYNAQLKATAILKGFEGALGSTNVELQKQVDILNRLKPAFDAANKAAAKGITSLPGLGASAEAARLASATSPAIEQFTKQQKVVTELQQRFNDLNANIDKSVQQFTNLRAPVDASTAAQIAADLAAKNLIKSTRDNEREQAKLARTLAKQKEEWDKLQSTFNKLARPNESDLNIDEQFRRENPVQPMAQDRPFSQYGLNQARLLIDETELRFKALQQNAIDTGNIIMSFLTPAIDSVFSAIESGENVFDAIGQSLKKLVLQLVATVAKAAILAAILTAIPGGAALAGIGSAAGGAGNAFPALLKAILGGGQLFGASGAAFGGVATQSTGMLMQGEVIFRQSGSDLVGVLNRTNGRINRVG